MDSSRLPGKIKRKGRIQLKFNFYQDLIHKPIFSRNISPTCNPSLRESLFISSLFKKLTVLYGIQLTKENISKRID
jgi:hypothetical protein